MVKFGLGKIGALLFVLAAVLIFYYPKIGRAEILDPAFDFDGDGFSNIVEIASGYSPYNPRQVRIEKNDADADGLNDYLELQFKTDPLLADSDSDGYNDWQEIDFAYNPLSSSSIRLERKIEISLKTQKLAYLVDGYPWKEFPISSGVASMPTPKGTYYVQNKSRKAWSKTYKLWMPYWLGLLSNGQIGIHELPIWPNGFREGESHLGKPASHGCIRLGVGSARYLYERVSEGTEVVIK